LQEGPVADMVRRTLTGGAMFATEGDNVWTLIISLFTLALGGIGGGGIYKLWEVWHKGRQDDQEFISTQYRKLLEDDRKTSREQQEESLEVIRRLRAKITKMESYQDEIKTQHTELAVENIHLRAAVADRDARIDRLECRVELLKKCGNDTMEGNLPNEETPP
jgi:hypothetical protein